MKAIACAIMVLSYVMYVAKRERATGAEAAWFIGWTTATIYFLLTP